MDERHKATLNTLRELCSEAHSPWDEVSLDGVESVMLSRYQRAQPTHWLGRLVGRKPPYHHTLQVQLRSALKEHARLDAECSNMALLERLPWQDITGTRVLVEVLASTIVELVEMRGARLELGEANAMPPELAQSWDRKQYRLIELARAQPTEAVWDELVVAANRLSDAKLTAVSPVVQRLLGVWPSVLKVTPAAWLKIRASDPFLNPRLELASPRTSLVKHLHLGGKGLNVKGLRALVSSPHFSALTSLYLGSNKLGDEGARLVAASEYLSDVKDLNLWSNGIRDAGARALARSNNLPSLELLSLRANLITDTGAHAWASSQLPALTWLDLASNQIQDEGARALLSSSSLPNLQRVSLQSNPIRSVSVLRDMARLKDIHLEV